MSMSTRWIVLFMGIICISCGPEQADSDPWAPEPSPALGKSDGLDSKDTSCLVVLRKTKRVQSTENEVIINGKFDVFEPVLAREGLEARILYSFDPADGFFSVKARAVPGGGNGYQRFEFDISSSSGSQGAGSHTVSKVVLVPYLRQGKARLFDQNTAGDKAKLYQLKSPDYKYSAGSKVCRPFKKQVPDWVGDLRIGKTLSQFDPCDNAVPLNQAFAIEEDLSGLLDLKYNLCFRVHKKGITDGWAEESKFNQFDTGIQARFSKNGQVHYVKGVFNKQIGDSFQYSVDLNALEPFDVDGCPRPGVPLEWQPGDPLAWVKASYTLHVNEQDVRPQNAQNKTFELFFGIDPLNQCQ